MTTTKPKSENQRAILILENPGCYRFNQFHRKVLDGITRLAPGGVAEWIAHPLHMREVRGSDPDLARVDSEDPLYNHEHRRWCIHPGFKTSGHSQPKSETESASGSKK